MSIDFSKAPEDTTHYVSGRHPNWWRIDTLGGGCMYWHSRGFWAPSSVDPIKSFSECCEIVARPTSEPFVSVEDAPPTGSTHDPVNSPSHYASGGVECIEAIKASMSHEAFLGYLKGNVQKYVFRYEKKVAPGEDLKKARWYLERLIKEIENGQIE